MNRHIVAAGGGLLLPDTSAAVLERYVLGLTGAAKPKVMFFATASGDDLGYVARFYETYARLGAEPSHVPLFRRTPADLRERMLAQDVVHVGGGNTRSMLAVWQEWGIDAALRECWNEGIVLTGSSAGAICWFEQGLTDSVAGDLVTLPCLGFLKGSFCPHYDSEKDRRPIYRRRVGSGEMLPGTAADDLAAIHYVDDAAHASIAGRPGASLYRVERGAQGAVETALPMQAPQYSRV